MLSEGSQRLSDAARIDFQCKCCHLSENEGREEEGRGGRRRVEVEYTFFDKLLAETQEYFTVVSGLPVQTSKRIVASWLCFAISVMLFEALLFELLYSSLLILNRMRLNLCNLTPGFALTSYFLLFPNKKLYANRQVYCRIFFAKLTFFYLSAVFLNCSQVSMMKNSIVM